ncbi:alpha/beta fold hydrolase [Glaciecola sp. SC05]|uniref:alpha/beta fold hydrolase n=1 Tax=Glaciecola sp. SC05 TaxID=1987355 RepID=UPI003527273D
MTNDVSHHVAQQVEANGLQITYDSFGELDNPVIVLIMGLGTQMIHWNDDFCQLLARKNFRVIRFDNRDIGKSSWLTDYPVPSVWHFIGNALFNKKVNAPYLLDDMADDTLALMDALDIDRAHLVGASMGGMIAQCVALKCPERVSSLTSIMSTTGNRSLPKAKTKVSAKLLKPLAKDVEAYVAQSLDVWKVLHGEHYSFDKVRVEKVLRESRERGFNPEGVARQLSAIIDSPDRTEALKKLQVPSLVIHGDADVLVPVECGIATAEAIPNATLKILKGMGHTLPMQLWPQIVDDICQVAKAGKG